jgi:hypothetical protein
LAFGNYRRRWIPECLSQGDLVKPRIFYPAHGYLGIDALELVRPPYYRIEAELLRRQDETPLAEVPVVAIGLLHKALSAESPMARLGRAR